MTAHPKPLLLRRLRALLVLLLALALPVALSGTAAADGSKSARTWTVQVGSESSDQAIQGMSFLPRNIFINAGDKVTWEANSAEIHTVTFLAAGQTIESTQPFDPFNPLFVSAQGGTSYDGHSYYNSGVMTNVSDSGFPEIDSYTLKFPDTGDFTYYCLVHGIVMKGTVHVRDKGTDYPFTQEQYNNRVARAERAILRDGYEQWSEARDQADDHTVFTGTDNGVAMVMRFIEEKVVIHVGESVSFVNNGMGAPHTVTFGAEPANFFPPLGDPTNYTGGQLNSGFMVPGTTFTVTFNKAGEYDYICALHDFMGMKGTVVVED
ncbi:plastocyanin/azurin family copper-binding protein [Arthrobacter sp. MMS18-M83]|uniref:plastocyanin/azurin family copper-binding protein n=1 Tax=Arthrobacter sp. MMS18-M83 TaxID=2996261 RepID=UPI00227C81BD|nr:plastocyanin/azurin family copper-binding protein [Arthrobacter sp. MMS18-M83]WAH95866.1 plastocyanin/azurin family copper-binding protein [Arthrobacter sp. MMS18-M83]